jgi:hypothetical protein
MLRHVQEGEPIWHSSGIDRGEVDAKRPATQQPRRTQAEETEAARRAAVAVLGSAGGEEMSANAAAKPRSRVITGWRQVAAVKTRSKPRSVPRPGEKTTPPAQPPVVDKTS